MDQPLTPRLLARMPAGFRCLCAFGVGNDAPAASDGPGRRAPVPDLRFAPQCSCRRGRLSETSAEKSPALRGGNAFRPQTKIFFSAEVPGASPQCFSVLSPRRFPGLPEAAPCAVWNLFLTLSAGLAQAHPAAVAAPGMKRSILFHLLLLLWCCSLSADGAAPRTRYYRTLNTRQGLSDNNVLQMLRLPDGRIVVETRRGIDVYDGQRFRFLPLADGDAQPLPLYEGHSHLYVDSRDRLWVKDFRRVCCIDLRRFRVVARPLEQVAREAGVAAVGDLFVDGRRDVWAVAGGEAVNVRSGVRLRCDAAWGALQDLDVEGGHAYTFHAGGRVAAFRLADGALDHVAAAYGEAEAGRYASTSLVAKSDDGRFYQLRTGRDAGVFLRFDPRTRQYAPVYACDHLLHTLTLASAGRALVSTPSGYLLFDLARGGRPQAIDSLFLPDGTSLTTGVNTILHDGEGGLWLGTYDKGLLYTSPLLRLFGTQPIDIEATPILTAVFLHGKPVEQGEAYGGRVLQPLAAPYADSLRFSSSQNDVAFQFGTMNQVNPRATRYRYRLNGAPWRQVSADTPGGVVGNDGVLYLSFLDLAPGDYELEVMASTAPGKWRGRVRRVRFVVQPPWWASPWAVAACALLALLALYLIYRVRRCRRRALARQLEREARLTARIRELVEQCNALEQSRQVVFAEADEAQPPAGAPAQLTEQEVEFLGRVKTLVEGRLSDPDYGVEQLARDLCMERTGLYKKLTAVVGKSPVLFIRNVRLRRAAELLRSGGMSVNEVADATGFNSPSYFAKCFKAEFGARPSEFH